MMEKKKDKEYKPTPLFIKIIAAFKDNFWPNQFSRFNDSWLQIYKKAEQPASYIDIYYILGF